MGVGWPQINIGPESTALRPIRLHLTGTSPFVEKATPAFVWASAQEEAGLAFPCSRAALPASGRLSAMRDTRYPRGVCLR